MFKSVNSSRWFFWLELESSSGCSCIILVSVWDVHNLISYDFHSPIFDPWTGMLFEHFQTRHLFCMPLLHRYLRALCSLISTAKVYREAWQLLSKMFASKTRSMVVIEEEIDSFNTRMGDQIITICNT